MRVPNLQLKQSPTRLRARENRRETPREIPRQIGRRTAWLQRQRCSREATATMRMPKTSPASTGVRTVSTAPSNESKGEDAELPR
eukprot:150555-Pleurochrysis_carterae.AAC.1